jgi:hypothetical protein
MTVSRLRFMLVPIAIALIALAVAVAVGLFAPMEPARALMDEDGPVEAGTAIVYAIAIVALWTVQHGDFGRLAKLASTIVLAACIAREISLRRYLNSLTASGCCVGDWLVGVLLLLMIVSAIGLFAWYYRALWKGIRQLRPVAITLVTIAGCLALSQFMDRAPHLMAAIEVSLGARARLVALSIEETLELVVPLLIVGAALQTRHNRTTESE